MLPLEPPVDAVYGELRARPETLIAPNNLLIIAEALSPDCVLVADDERAFSHIAGLALENWRRCSGCTRPSVGVDRARIQRYDHII